MIAEIYVEWAAGAPAHTRAEATAALCRSYLYGDLEPEIARDVEAVLTLALDDPSLAVRCALSDAFAASHDAPHAIVLSLARDAPDVAEPILSRSPLLGDVELVDLVALGGARAEIAIARRPSVSAPVAAAIAEVAGRHACAAVLRNSGARLTHSSAERIAARHGVDVDVREALLARGDLGPEIRQMVMRSVASALSSFVTARGWMGADRARRAVDEACDRGALAIAGDALDARRFVLHLAGRGEFSASFALRAVLCGNVALLEAALSALSGQSPARVAGFVRDSDGRGFEAAYLAAGFPASALPAFRAALSAGREFGFAGTHKADAELSRRMVERTLTACGGDADADVAALRALLRRFSAEAARDDVRRVYAPASAVAA